MKKRNVLLPFFSGIAFALLGAVIYASSVIPMQQISHEFDEINQKWNQLAQHQDPPLVQGENVRITIRDFIFYKSNLELLYRLQDKAFTLTDEELIDAMLQQRLTVQYAKQAGLTATEQEQEIDEVIAQEREVLYDSQISAVNKDIIKEIMDNRIRITGLSEEDFWNSEDVKKSYEDAILLGKLYSQLLQEGKIQNAEDFVQFQNELLQKAKKSLKIHRELLDEHQ